MIEINDNVKNNKDDFLFQMNGAVTLQTKGSSKVEKYPTDKNHHYYFSTKYWERIQNTNHCYEKNVLKGIILLPFDATIFGLNILGTIASNLFS